jgi:hypothetical protein
LHTMLLPLRRNVVPHYSIVTRVSSEWQGKVNKKLADCMFQEVRIMVVKELLRLSTYRYRRSPIRVPDLEIEFPLVLTGTNIAASDHLSLETSPRSRPAVPFHPAARVPVIASRHLGSSHGTEQFYAPNDLDNIGTPACFVANRTDTQALGSRSWILVCDG